MSEIVMLFLSFSAGLLLGCFYFGGLWLTVRHLPQSRRPLLLTLGSYGGRIGLTLLGFYAVMGGRWERLAVCFLAFLLVRLVMVRRLGPQRQIIPGT